MTKTKHSVKNFKVSLTKWTKPKTTCPAMKHGRAVFRKGNDSNKAGIRDNQWTIKFYAIYQYNARDDIIFFTQNVDRNSQ